MKQNGFLKFVDTRKWILLSIKFVRYNILKLENDEDVITTFSIFAQYIFTGPIELDTTMHHIEASLVRIIDEIMVCMIESDEESMPCCTRKKLSVIHIR